MGQQRRRATDLVRLARPFPRWHLQLAQASTVTPLTPYQSARGLCMRLAAVALFLSFAQPAEPETSPEGVPFIRALHQGALMGCLSWTRDGVPLSTFSDTMQLTRHIGKRPASVGPNPTVWRKDFAGGHLLLLQENLALRPCTTIMFGVSAELVIAVVEDGFVTGFPEEMRFAFLKSTQSAEIETRSYRQEQDHNINATLSLQSTAEPQGDTPTAILSFHHGPSPDNE